MEGMDVAKKTKPWKDMVALAAILCAPYAEGSEHGLCR